MLVHAVYLSKVLHVSILGLPSDSCLHIGSPLLLNFDTVFGGYNRLLEARNQSTFEIIQRIFGDILVNSNFIAHGRLRSIYMLHRLKRFLLKVFRGRDQMQHCFRRLLAALTRSALVVSLFTFLSLVHLVESLCDLNCQLLPLIKLPTLKWVITEQFLLFDLRLCLLVLLDLSGSLPGQASVAD